MKCQDIKGHCSLLENIVKREILHLFSIFYGRFEAVLPDSGCISNLVFKI